jgi:hypothetical protein
MSTPDITELQEEQDDLKNMVKVLKGVIRKLEVMAKSPCGDCEYWREQLESYKKCSNCGRPLYCRCDVCEAR